MDIWTEIGETMSGAAQAFCKLVSRRHACAIWRWQWYISIENTDAKYQPRQNALL